MSILKLENVTYRYSTKYIKVDALKGISYEFEPGSVYAIVGKSGSGKTTLLSLLAGLDNPTSGDIYFDGRPLRGMDRSKFRRNEISVVFQSFQLFPLMTALENVMYPMTQTKVKRGEAKKRAKELLLSTGLTERHFGQFPSMLSGGEQQRVAIARALGNTPKVILADEPTGNLDTENSEHTINALVKLAKDKGCCVIIITHDPSVAEKSDKQLHISDGLMVL